MSMPAYDFQSMEGVFEKTFEITEELTDESGQMQAGDFARLMESITERHLEFYGLNLNLRKEENKMWVIAWNQLEINRLPKLGEKTVLRIWPCKNKAGMYPRKYAFYTEDGESLAGAGSLFILMDAISRTAAAPSEKLAGIPMIKVENEPELPKMMMKFPEEFDGVKERTVQPMEIDKNGHLNNSHYVDWAVQLAQQVLGNKEIPKNIWIQYSKELLESETAVMSYKSQGGQFFIVGRVNENESFKVAFDYH